jgi:hypothetical protein
MSQFCYNLNVYFSSFIYYFSTTATLSATVNPIFLMPDLQRASFQTGERRLPIDYENRVILAAMFEEQASAGSDTPSIFPAPINPTVKKVASSAGRSSHYTHSTFSLVPAEPLDDELPPLEEANNDSSKNCLLIGQKKLWLAFYFILLNGT